MFSDLNDSHLTFAEKLDYTLNQIRKNVGKFEYRLCFSDRVNFRKELEPTYKGNRTTRKPMGFLVFREQIMEKYPSICKPTLEADDVLGILATKPGADAIIVSGDKDLMQVPGKHLVNGDIVTVTEEEGDYFHLQQTLTGDTVDGYAGCPGIGPVKAKTILDTEDRWAAIVAAYDKAGFPEEHALLQARLARILRWQDWDNQQQKVILWNPKNN